MNESLAKFEAIHESNFTIASGITTFIKAIKYNADVYATLADVKSEDIQNRIKELTQVEFDTNYRHPHDVKIAVYLYYLYERDYLLAKQVYFDICDMSFKNYHFTQQMIAYIYHCVNVTNKQWWHVPEILKEIREAKKRGAPIY